MGWSTSDSLSENEMDARTLLGRIGADSAPYFPAEPVQVPCEPYESAAELGARVASL